MNKALHIPPELVAKITPKRKDPKPLTNYDVFIITQTLINRLNDIYNVVLATEGVDVENILISPDNLNSDTMIRYINLINTLIGAIQEKVKNIENGLSLNGS